MLLMIGCVSVYPSLWKSDQIVHIFEKQLILKAFLFYKEHNQNRLIVMCLTLLGKCIKIVQAPNSNIYSILHAKNYI